MKYAGSWLAGAVFGALLLLVALYYNPIANKLTVSPLAVSGQPLIDLTYSAVPSEAIAFINNGESRISPYPEKIAELWEPTIRKTTLLVTLLTDARGQAKGIGVKFASESEDTSLLKGRALVDSAWHVYLPESGSLFVDQTENMWSYGRNIVLPARWSSADNWRGTWHGITTAGPNALGTARVAGSSGRFADLTTEAVETLNARAYSALQGPVSATGSLTIAAAEPTAN
jgi:hypothetical protein